MVVEAEHGGVVFLHESAFGLFGRKQPARHAMAERRGRYARNKSFANLLKACCQQPQRIKCQQNCGGRQRRARREPNEYPQGRPSPGRRRVRWLGDKSRKPPSRRSARKWT